MTLRGRASVDFSRLREAVAGPGIDPRTWVLTARIDDDPDAMVWDDKLGWLVDVTPVTGQLAGSTMPLACRVATAAQGPDIGMHHPPRLGGLVLVVIPSGDPNEDSIIIGQLHDVDDGAPARVNGDTIDEDFARQTHIAALPDEDVDQEWRHARITASDAMVLGTADADQAMVRGDDLADALSDLADALSQFAVAIAVAPVNIAGAVVALDPGTLTSFQQAVTAFKSASQTYLSTRITVD